MAVSGDDRRFLDQWLAGAAGGERSGSAALGRLAELARPAMYAPGEFVVREGVPVATFGIVVDGRLAIRVLIPERGTTTIQTLEPGEIVGWSAIVAPNVSTSTVVALEPTRLLAFDAADLRAALTEPTIAAAVLMPVADALARRLVASRTQLLDLFAGSGFEPW